MQERLIYTLFTIGFSVLFFPYLLGEVSAIAGSIFCLASLLWLLFYNSSISRTALIFSLSLATLATFAAFKADLVAIAFFAMPMVIVALSATVNQRSIINVNDLLNIYGYLSLVSGLIALFQYFIDPSLGGFALNRVYNESTWGTSTFRVTGVFGSAQNNALLFAAGLFASINNKYIRALHLVICATAGALTLSTFFGGALLVRLVMPLRFRVKVFLAAAALLGLSSFEFRNTPLEFLSFVELMELDERYIAPEQTISFFDVFFGKGLGLATQGMIDRGIATFDTFETESSLAVFLFENGLIFTSLLLCVALYRLYISYIYFGAKSNIFNLYIVILLNFVTVPTFSTLRLKIIFFLFFTLPFPLLERRYMLKNGIASFKLKL